MSNKNPHILKNSSLFAMFCLSYFPLFLLLSIKILINKSEMLHFSSFTWEGILAFLENFGFLSILIILSLYAFFGTSLTLKNIKRVEGSYNPVFVTRVKPKNEEALAYLVTYVIPLLAQDNLGPFEYITFAVLFIIYYKLYSTSSLILINPILNMKYGLFEIEYSDAGKVNSKEKHAMVIANQRWINEDDQIKMLKVGQNLFFATT